MWARQAPILHLSVERWRVGTKAFPHCPVVVTGRGASQPLSAGGDWAFVRESTRGSASPAGEGRLGSATPSNPQWALPGCVCHTKSPMAEEMEIMLEHPWMGTLSSCQSGEKIGDANHRQSCFSWKLSNRKAGFQTLRNTLSFASNKILANLLFKSFLALKDNKNVSLPLCHFPLFPKSPVPTVFPILSAKVMMSEGKYAKENTQEI